MVMYITSEMKTNNCPVFLKAGQLFYYTHVINDNKMMQKRKEMEIGIIGVRGRGSYLAMLYNQHKNAQVVAAADPDPAAFEAAKDRFREGGITDLHCYSDAGEMILKEKAGMDWIFIASPDRTHYGYAREALVNGYHVFIEKPMCTSRIEADELIRTAKENKKHAVVGVELRFAEPVIQFKDLLQSGEIGDILHAVCLDSISKGFTYFLRDYRKKQWSKSLVYQKGIHSLDLLSFFSGSSPKRVFADGSKDFFGKKKQYAGRFCRSCVEEKKCPYSAYRVRSWKSDFGQEGEHAKDHCVYDPAADVEDNMALLINYKNGLRATYNAVYFAARYSRRFHFFGTGGEAILILDQSAYEGIDGRGWDEGGVGKIILLHNKKNDEVRIFSNDGLSHWGGDHAMRDYLVKKVLSGTKSEERIRPDVQDGRDALAICEAALLSFTSGKAECI